MMRHVFLIGAKSLGAYGGYETFIDKLTEYHSNKKDIQYHVAVKGNGIGSKVPEGALMNERGYTYHNADCFIVNVPTILGPAQAIYYDCVALSKAIETIENEHIENPIVYVMTCRIGPFYKHYVDKIHQLGGKLILNPDGHEWLRKKWSKPVRAYWKYSEKLMVQYSDYIVCDSKVIEDYIHNTYHVKNTTYISYGAETKLSTYPNTEFEKWLKEKGIKKDNYYLSVGRFVPENNYETMIKEFMKSGIEKDYVIITNYDEDSLNKLESLVHFSQDKRIKFIGIEYDQDLLKKIRENAYGSIHGHEVGGTNPSLLEALASTKLNLVYDVNFNKEVAQEGAFYWSKQDNSLRDLLNQCEGIDRSEISKLAFKRIVSDYTWKQIAKQYEQLWQDDRF